MNIFRIFGIGNKSIIDSDCCINAEITNIKTFGFTPKKYRNLPNDEAYPNIITFTYNVDGVVYTGKRYIRPGVICPHLGERILIYYKTNEPGKYAVEI